MGNVNVQSTVTKYLVARVGKTIIVNEMTSETGLRDEQIRAVMRRLINRNVLDIDVISKGHVWRVNGADPKPDAPVFTMKPEPSGYTGISDLPPLADLTKPVQAKAAAERPLTCDDWEIYRVVGKASDGSEIVELGDRSMAKLTML